MPEGEGGRGKSGRRGGAGLVGFFLLPREWRRGARTRENKCHLPPEIIQRKNSL